MMLPEYPTMSVEDYLILDNNSTDVRFEYLDGELRMLAGGTNDHSKITANMIGILYNHLNNKPCSTYSPDMRLQLSESRYVYPDVMVSCDQRDNERANTVQYPCLVVEVLSPSTEMIDRVKKLAYYQACPSIQEYVMIDSQRYQADVYHRKTEKKWVQEILGLEDILVLECLNVQIPVKDLYRRVSFV